MKNLLLGVVLGFVWLFASLSAHADSFTATLYGDGFSCPNNCDAHVVFHEDYNATKYASLPSSSRTQPTNAYPAKIAGFALVMQTTRALSLYIGDTVQALIASTSLRHSMTLDAEPLTYRKRLLANAPA